MILEDSFEKRFEALKNKKPIKEKKEILFRKDEGYNQKIYALYDAEHYEEAYTKLIDLAMQTATFRGQQGRISRPVKAILSGRL